MTELLTTSGLGKRFGGLAALTAVDLNVASGSIHAVIGPNGSGKTTLFNVISGVYQPSTGSVRFREQDVTGLAPERLATMGLARTFQNTRLFASMSVVENVLAVLHRRGLGFRIGAASVKRAREILDAVGLLDAAEAAAASLPQGQRRLLEIAKALALRPRLLLLDEPHGGLNHTETARLIEVVRSLHRQGLTILLIEHEMEVVMRLADAITVLNFGETLARGTPAAIQADERVIEAYLGRTGNSANTTPANQVAATSGATLLDVQKLGVRFGDITAVRGVSLTVREGEMVALLGNNGAGKSTTLKAIARLVPAEGGVRFAGMSLMPRRVEELAALGIALVPERRRLFGALSVIENLRVGAHGRPRADQALAIEEVLELFPSLRRLARSLAFALSGGEQQMLAIGRALMSRPRLLMLDEPSLGLAPMLVEQVFAKLVEINRRGTAVLLVEQNARMALAVSHRAYVLASGVVVAEGRAATLAEDPRVRDAYLGVAA